MPAPLWEDAKNYLQSQGVPLSSQSLNGAMDFLYKNPDQRPSYSSQNQMVSAMGGPTGVAPPGVAGIGPNGPNASMWDDYGAAPAGQELSPGARVPDAEGIMTTELPGSVNYAQAQRPPKVTTGASEGYSVPAKPRRAPPVPGGDARVARSQNAGPGKRLEANDPDIPGGAPPGPGQATANTASAPRVGEQGQSGQQSGNHDWLANLLSGLGFLGAAAGGAALMGRGGAAARGRPGAMPGQTKTPPGGGSGSGFAGQMPGGTSVVPDVSMAMNRPGPLLGQSVTMPLPPPTPAAAIPMPGPAPTTVGGPYTPTEPVMPMGSPPIAGALPGPVDIGSIIGAQAPRPASPPPPQPKPRPKTTGNPSQNSGRRVKIVRSRAK